MSKKFLVSILVISLSVFFPTLSQAGEISEKSKIEKLKEASEEFSLSRIALKEKLNKDIKKLSKIKDKAINKAKKLKDNKKANELINKAHKSYLESADKIRDLYYLDLKKLREIYLNSK